MSLSGAVLIITVVIIRTLTLHKLPKKTFFVLWGVVICRLLIPFFIPSRFSLYTSIDMLKRTVTETTAITALVKTTGIPNMGVVPDLEHTVGIGASVVSVLPVTIIWLAGMCACALFFIVPYIKCRREFQTALPVTNNFIALWLREHPIQRPVPDKAIR